VQPALPARAQLVQRALQEQLAPLVRQQAQPVQPEQQVQDRLARLEEPVRQAQQERREPR
jgi:hypothetical protein